MVDLLYRDCCDSNGENIDKEVTSGIPDKIDSIVKLDLVIQ